MGRIVSKDRVTRFPPSGPRGFPNDLRSFMADLRELEQAILAAQIELENQKVTNETLAAENASLAKRIARLEVEG